MKKTRFKSFLCIVLVMMLTFSFMSVSAGAASVSEARHSVVYIEIGYDNNGDWHPYSSGSGFFVWNSEYIITNHHVVDTYLDLGRGQPIKFSEYIEYCISNGIYSAVEGAAILLKYGDSDIRMMIRVYFDDYNYVQATVVDYDDVRDLAIIRIASPTDKRVDLILCPPTEDMVGEIVAAVGYPGVMEGGTYKPAENKSETAASALTGTISKLQNIEGTIVKAVVTDTNIMHGNSGGPLVTTDGYAVGVCAWGHTNSNGESIQYAINIEEAIALLDKNNIDHHPVPAPESDTVPVWLIAALAAIAVIIVILLVVKLRKPKSVPAPEPSTLPTPPVTPDNLSSIETDEGPETPGDTGFRIQFRAGNLSGQRFMIKNTGTILIGRDNGCNIKFPSDPKAAPGVSGQHCLVWYQDKTIYIQDKSSKGTFVNNKRLVKTIVLNVGDVVNLGSPQQQFVIDVKNRG